MEMMQQAAHAQPQDGELVRQVEGGRAAEGFHAWIKGQMTMSTP